jgi:hypothetical protein
LPDAYREFGIVVLNTARPELVDERRGAIPRDVQVLVQAGERGYVDARPVQMQLIRHDLDRILQHGGVVIAIASHEYKVTYLRGKQGYSFHTEREFTISNWEALSIFDGIDRANRSGREIHYSNSRLAQLLSKGSDGASYSCVLTPNYRVSGQWEELATEKYGKVVAALVRPTGARGPLLVLPEMPSLHTILGDLITTWAAQMCPSLFPDAETQGWIHSQEYEVPEVLALRGKLDELQARVEHEVKELSSAIAQAQEAHKDWYNLISGTDAPLVTATMAALRAVGFTKIIDVDVPPLYDPVYDPLWSACEDLEVPVTHHSGQGAPDYGKHSFAMFLWISETSWFSHRPLTHLIVGGIFFSRRMRQYGFHTLNDAAEDRWRSTIRRG